MIRVAKLTDYGIALMAHLASRHEGESVTARDLAEFMGLPLPTVSKLLKILTRCDLLVSQRGAKGGYTLAGDPDRISLADLVNVLEGPVSMTECASEKDCDCNLLTDCEMKDNWNLINRRVMASLEDITLREMAGTLSRRAETQDNGASGREPDGKQG